MRRLLLLCLLCVCWGFTSTLSGQTPLTSLRGAFLGANPVHARIDPQTGAATGPVPDLIREMAKLIGVPAALVPEASVAAVIAAVSEGRADVGFLAFDEERAKDVDFGAPFLVMLSSYLVKTSSPVQTSADVDRAGVTVGAVKGVTQQLFVSRTFKNATVRLFDEMPTQREVERLLESNDVGAFAVNRQRALDAEAAAGGRLRALPDSFMRVNQAIVVPKGQRERLVLFNSLVEELRDSGVVKASVERAGITGVELPR